MNAHERLRKRLRAEPVDRPPNLDIMMVFAAHYTGQPLSRYYLDHRVMCEANLAVLEAFELDVVQTISDSYREAADLGAEVEFPADGQPVCRVPLLAEPATLRRLRPLDPSGGRRTSDQVAAVRDLRGQVGDAVPVMGWVEGALAEAAVLRGTGSLLTDLYDRPEWLREVLELCVEGAIAFARAQVAAGAHIIGLGDAIASQVSPAMYRDFALPYEQRVFAAVHEMGALARLHICGNITRLLALVGESGADIVDIDWMVDLERASATLGERVAVCGNFDPVAIMLQGSPDDVRQAVWAGLRQGGPRALSAAGCEIPDGTPAANLRAQATALREWADN
ncbi:MAG: uroporphyrinogen decarboxylase family protein [Chloroflexota bacterium]